MVLPQRSSAPSSTRSTAWNAATAASSAGCSQHRFSNMARILATIIIGFGFYYFIGSEMMPLADVGQAYGVLEMAPGPASPQPRRPRPRSRR